MLGPAGASSVPFWMPCVGHFTPEGGCVLGAGWSLAGPGPRWLTVKAVFQIIWFSAADKMKQLEQTGWAVLPVNLETGLRGWCALPCPEWSPGGSASWERSSRGWAADRMDILVWRACLKNGHQNCCQRKHWKAENARHSLFSTESNVVVLFAVMVEVSTGSEQRTACVLTCWLNLTPSQEVLFGEVRWNVMRELGSLRPCCGRARGWRWPCCEVGGHEGLVPGRLLLCCISYHVSSAGLSLHFKKLNSASIEE